MNIVNIGTGDVIYAEVDTRAMTLKRSTTYLEQVKTVIKDCFPDNKVILVPTRTTVDRAIDITIIKKD